MADVWSNSPDVFKTASEVARFVSSRFKTHDGNGVSERTVRGHLQGRTKKGKLLFPRPEGGYAKEDVKNYVGRMGYVPLGEDPLKEEKEKSSQQVSLEVQQEEKKLEKLILQNKNLEFELDQKRKEFCRVADLDAELASRGLALRHFIEQYVSDRARDIIGVEQERVVDVIMDGVDQALSDYVSLDSFYVLQIG